MTSKIQKKEVVRTHRERRVREQKFIQSRAQVKLPYQPDHVTEEQIKRAIDRLVTC